MGATYKVGVTDNAAGAGVAELMASAIAQLNTNAQIMDILPAGDDFSMKAVSASVTVTTTSVTIPPWDCAAFQVPAGKFVVLDRASILRYAAAPVSLRVCTRYMLAGNCAQAAPAAGGAPTVAATTLGFTSGLGTGSYSYKISQVNALGQEGPLSTVSATVTPTSTQSISITIPALGTGAVAYRIYRSLSGAGGTGPWYWVDDAIAGAYLDQVADSYLTTVRGSTQHPGTTWGTAFNPASVPQPPGPVEMIYENVGVALSAAPTTLYYLSGKGIPSAVAFAPAVTVNTRVRIPPSGEGRGFAASGPGSFQLQNPQIADYGATRVFGFNNTYAAAGGQWVIWGYAPQEATVFEAAAVAGGRNMSKFWKPCVFGPGDTIVGQVFSSGTAAASVLELEIQGRMFDIPT